MINFIVLLSLALVSFAGKTDVWDPQDPATPSILKFIEQFDLDNDQLFEKEEYKRFFFLVMESELKDIGFPVSEEQSQDLDSCSQNFVDYTDKDQTSYEEFIQDFQKHFIAYLDEDENRCTIARNYWKRFLTNSGATQQNKRRKRKRTGDL